MPPRKPGPDPDQTTPNLPVLASAKVWETGVAPNDTRIPGTRRLWLAGALALAVVSSCVTALMLQGTEDDDTSRSGGDRTTAAGDSVLPDLTLPEAPPSSTAAPDGKSGLSEPQGAEDEARNDDDQDKDSSDSSSKDSDSSDDKQQGGAKPTAKPTNSTAPSKKPPSTSTSWKSVRSINYPDRYWHLRSGVIQLDQVSSRSGSETREDSSFKLVSGLANSSCYSFRMTDGRYVRHQNFVLRASGNDGSALFKQDATFCPRSYTSGTVMLESVNYPGYFVRHRSFQLRLERYDYSRLFYADSTFSLVRSFSS
ncbi:AbfB domain-containing protein [Streptomyces ipomoeae]|uniref:Alpha-L-arabinofuranosidase B (ABFB) n=1 Tax=Streptomyces ipomoeae 91-03 TaxID=698759 RepID=L1KVF3_9ACTN|nr:AbfB domain-containing protein [Streptomyces ipomoeae]EKX64529.1 alpha-L-arabinofuranosidase B (ABFB) [Streptomyces ipomoeae 91-03]MDX2695574.1 AbfB domain-containing protein [Streptomyces ipomoeae]MDX2841532.1 AbfB domain-containing protein [Streptomyces ipomoeae]